ncbi:uncharacterized protein [Coffea arabica]|uniref:RNase H type-1 domain-containing protein n=1 Tax=Coffea arabica TaxID=13443 RepID=A0A6P6WYX5_COFAR|nr:uncharacterized protein LOC113737491 [Coffea arabica]
MAAKYCSRSHPCMVGVASTDSHIWRRMMAVREAAEQNIVWLVQSGDSNFWFDNWLGSGPLCQRLENVSDHQVKDFMSQGRWNKKLLLQWVPSRIIDEILKKEPPLLPQCDHMIWKLNQLGAFSLASAFQVIKYASESSFMFSKVWISVLPLKISFFMVRLLRNRLLVVSSLVKFHVQGPSKCFCYLDSQSKTLDHVFSEGEFAQQLWSFFGSAVGVSYLGVGVRSRLAAWWFHCRENGFVHAVLPILFCWQIWKARNRKVFEEREPQLRSVCDWIFRELRDMFNLKFPNRLAEISSWPNYYIAVKFGGGGILHDGNGVMVFAFTVPFREMSSVQAKAKLLLFGVQQCIQCGFVRLHVEVDSLLVVQILQNKAACPWKIWAEMEKIKGCMRFVARVTHWYGGGESSG